MARKRIRRPARAPRDLARIGARLRRLRERAGLSQEELGSPHATRSAVSRIESGAAAPSLPLLIHFSRRLGVKVRELFPPDL